MNTLTSPINCYLQITDSNTGLIHAFKHPSELVGIPDLIPLDYCKGDFLDQRDGSFCFTVMDVEKYNQDTGEDYTECVIETGSNLYVEPSYEHPYESYTFTIDGEDIDADVLYWTDELVSVINLYSEITPPASCTTAKEISKFKSLVLCKFISIIKPFTSFTATPREFGGVCYGTITTVNTGIGFMFDPISNQPFVIPHYASYCEDSDTWHLGLPSVILEAVRLFTVLADPMYNH